MGNLSLTQREFKVAVAVKKNADRAACDILARREHVDLHGGAGACSNWGGELEMFVLSNFDKTNISSSPPQAPGWP